MAGSGKKKGLLFVVSGPSGTGKTTLLKKLCKKKGLKGKLIKSISVTTRAARAGEKNGRDYFFINHRQFQKKSKAKRFLEYTRYSGYYYATSKDFVLEQLKKGKSVILCLDTRGAVSIKKAYPRDTITIFVMPPSLKALERRIKNRCLKTEREEINKRLGLAKNEIARSIQYEHRILNKDLDKAAEELSRIILEELTERANN